MMILLEETCKESNQSILSKNTPLKVDELGLEIERWDICLVFNE
jgi:hypothetical protein